VCVSRVPFIPPALAKLRPSPPAGEGWQYELKFDGWRAQLHKTGRSAAIYGKNGGDLTRRFPTIATAVLALPVRTCIIDGELIAAGAHGEPDFLALLRGRDVPVCVYGFDLMGPAGPRSPRAAARTASGLAAGAARAQQERPDTVQRGLPQRGVLRTEGCDVIYREKVSGKSMRNRPELEKAIDQLGTGDILIVAEWDRATRSMIDGVAIIDRIHKRGALIRCSTSRTSTSRRPSTEA
jgi:hypothetical protein